MKGISSVRLACGCHCASALTFASETRFPSQLRRTDSNTIRIETGSREIRPNPAFSSAGREKNEPCLPFPKSNVCRVPENLFPVIKVYAHESVPNPWPSKVKFAAPSVKGTPALRLVGHLAIKTERQRRKAQRPDCASGLIPSKKG